MPKYLSIQIPEPCHENWDNMTTADQGRYCNACAKTVIDFSAMTDTQVLNYFKKDTGNTCGRFHNDQLINDILIPKKQIPWLRYFFTITIPAFLFSLKSSAQIKVNSAKMEKTENVKAATVQDYMGGGYTIYDSAAANGKREMTTGEVWIKKETLIKKDSIKTLQEVIITSLSPTKKSCYTTGAAISIKSSELKNLEKFTTADISKNLLGKVNRNIKGRILDENNNPISGVSILIKGSKQSTLTNEFGNFNYNINPENKILIVCSFAYVTKEIEISDRDFYNIKLVKLKSIYVDAVNKTNCLSIKK